MYRCQYQSYNHGVFLWLPASWRCPKGFFEFSTAPCRRNASRLSIPNTWGMSYKYLKTARIQVGATEPWKKTQIIANHCVYVHSILSTALCTEYNDYIWGICVFNEIINYDMCYLTFAASGKSQTLPPDSTGLVACQRSRYESSHGLTPPVERDMNAMP